MELAEPGTATWPTPPRAAGRSRRRAVQGDRSQRRRSLVRSSAARGPEPVTTPGALGVLQPSPPRSQCRAQPTPTSPKVLGIRAGRAPTSAAGRRFALAQDVAQMPVLIGIDLAPRQTLAEDALRVVSL